MKPDKFDRPYSQRHCPDGMVPEVWAAFAAWADSGNGDAAGEKWLFYLSVHAKYYDATGKKLETADNVTAQANLF